jgi:hypothetical protein
VFPVDDDGMAVVLNRPEFWAKAQEWVQDIRLPQEHAWATPMIDRMRDMGLDRQKTGWWA